uniref:Uncharacterized protein n=1 Tax=Megaselia scalaris TaxID=36166 RepID=T1GKK5_MEGSC
MEWNKSTIRTKRLRWRERIEANTAANKLSIQRWKKRGGEVANEPDLVDRNAKEIPTWRGQFNLTCELLRTWMGKERISCQSKTIHRQEK